MFKNEKITSESTKTETEMINIENESKPKTWQQKQVAQLWQRDCVSLNDGFKGWVNLRLNFRLQGYFSRHYTIYPYVLNHLNIYFSDGTLQTYQISHFTVSKDSFTS